LLPPLSAIVVQENSQYDGHRHGMTGGGYLAAEAESRNLAGRRRDNGWERWGKKPRPADAEIWTMKSMIEAHQNMVWDFDNHWPEQL